MNSLHTADRATVISNTTELAAPCPIDLMISAEPHSHLTVRMPASTLEGLTTYERSMAAARGADLDAARLLRSIYGVAS